MAHIIKFTALHLTVFCVKCNFFPANIFVLGLPIFFQLWREWVSFKLLRVFGAKIQTHNSFRLWDFNFLSIFVTLSHFCRFCLLLSCSDFEKLVDFVSFSKFEIGCSYFTNFKIISSSINFLLISANGQMSSNRIFLFTFVLDICAKAKMSKSRKLL